MQTKRNMLTCLLGAVTLSGLLSTPAAGQVPPVAGPLAAEGAALATDPALLDADRRFRGGIPEGFVLVEGDILVPMHGQRATHNALRWTNGEVPYAFDTTGSDAVSATNQALVLNAMQGTATFTGWEDLANVQFRPFVPGDANFIFIRDSSNDVDATGAPNPTNSSPIGMLGGPQGINLAFSGNGSTLGVISHELGHALGFYHEQSRLDRNGFVQINTGCIEAGKENNFDLRSGAGGEYGPYDYGSIMHYGAGAFADGTCQTIVVTPPADTSTYSGDPNNIGQRNAMSPWDGKVMSFLYPEDDWSFTDGTTAGTGTFESPFAAFLSAYNGAPEGGTVWALEPGDYATGGTLSRPMTIRAGYLPVTLTD